MEKIWRSGLLTIAALSILLGLFSFSLFSTPSSASSNIVPGAKFSWSENAGWTNWSPTGGGAWIAGTGLMGYLWLENVGHRLGRQQR